MTRFAASADRRWLSVLLLLLAVSCSQAASNPPDVRDDQIEALLAKMTLEEKAGQLTLLPAAAPNGPTPQANRAPTPMDVQLAEVRAGRVGALFNGAGAGWAREMQRTAVEQSRLGIPILLAADAIHGFRTVFPVPLAEAATWEPALAQRIARATAVEASAAGIAWNLAPSVDISRDARWGRGVEGGGEDVLLAKRFAEARVRGYQGSAQGSALNRNDAVLATPKHFVGYGAVEGGLDYNSVELTERTLHEVHLPPFKAALDAGALAVMAAFHEMGGIPIMANRALLIDLLRGQWGFSGIVVSDYGADREMVDHGYAKDEREAVKIAILAGVDMSMSSGAYLRHLPSLVQSGEVSIQRLDEAVRRVLHIKKKLGLFAQPYGRMDVAREKRLSFAPPARELAREAARRSIVLLKNDNNLLPLPRKGKRIALIGPLGSGPGDINGPWTVFDDRRQSQSVESGLRAALEDPSLLTVTQGSDVETPIPGGIEAAVAAANAADVVLLAVGEGEAMSGEAQSRADIIVPPAQQQLADAVAATGKPLVVLLRTGRALALQGAVREADAILVTWFLGLQTGPAIADVLFGGCSPSGRLPVSFPQTPGQVPYYYARKNTGRPPPLGDFIAYTARYRGLSPWPLYPFGHGLSYSSIRYDAVKLSTDRLRWHDTLQIDASITNTGARSVEEVVQLYVHDRVASVTRPIRELKDFKKISIDAGQAAHVKFTLSRKDLEFVGGDLQVRAEPGTFELWVAPNAQAGEAKTFELLPAE